MSIGFFLIEYSTAQGCGDADYRVQLPAIYEVLPFTGEIDFVLGRNDRAAGVVHAVLIKEQPDNLMAAGEHGFGEAQRAT